MTELFPLFLVLFLVYVLQCIAGGPAAAVIFRVSHRLKGRWLRRPWRVGRSQYQVFLQNPFLPFHGAVYVDAWPFAMRRGPEGEFMEVFFDPENSPKTFPLAAGHTIAGRAKQVLIDGEVVCTLSCESAAQNVAAFLTKLHTSPPKQRRAIIEAQFQKMLSLVSLDKRREQYFSSAGSLHIFCGFLLAFIFLIAPIMLALRGLDRLWPYLLLYLAFFSGSIAWLFRRSYRQLFTNSAGSFQHILIIAISPFAAIRANDALLTNIFSGFLPLAVAYRVLSKDEFFDFAQKELRRLKFLTKDDLLERAITQFLLREGIEPTALLGAPEPVDPRSRSYCPVCLTEYVIDTGECQDCDGVGLHSFPGAGGQPKVDSSSTTQD